MLRSIYSSALRYLFVAFLLGVPALATAQVFNQNQIITTPYGNNGWVVSTTTSGGNKLMASSTPYFANYSFGNATGTSATTTYSFATTASSTNLFTASFSGAGLVTCSGSSFLQWTVGKFSCAASSAGAAYPFTVTTPAPGNATSTLTQFNGGLTSYASTTIGDGTQVGGLTVSGGATTTLNAYFASKVGIGTSSPLSSLSIQKNYGDVSNFLTLASSTAADGSTATNVFAINSIGNIGIGIAPSAVQNILISTTTTATNVAFVSLNVMNSSGTATNRGIETTSTAGSGTTGNLTTVTNGGVLRNRYITNNTAPGYNVAQQSSLSALVQVNGTLASTTNASSFHAEAVVVSANDLLTNFYGLWVRGGSVAGTLTNRYGVYIDDLIGGTNRYGFYQTGASDLNYFSGSTGVGTTSPWAKLSVGIANQSSIVPIFAVASSSAAVATSTLFIINGTGNVGIGTTSPYANLSVQSGASTGDAFAVATSSGAAVFGVDNDGHTWTSGPAPAISSCGTGSPTVTGDDQSGTITTGSLASSCTATFSKAYRKTPSCNVTTDSVVALGDVSSISTTAVTFGLSASLSGGHLYYSCQYHL